MHNVYFNRVTKTRKRQDNRHQKYSNNKKAKLILLLKKLLQRMHLEDLSSSTDTLKSPSRVKYDFQNCSEMAEL